MVIKSIIPARFFIAMILFYQINRNIKKIPTSKVTFHQGFRAKLSVFSGSTNPLELSPHIKKSITFGSPVKNFMKVFAYFA